MSTTTPINGTTQPTGLLPTQQPSDPAREQQKPEPGESSAGAGAAVEPDPGARPADLAALSRLREHAEQVVAIQDDPAIATAKTDADLAAEAEQRQQHRADLRHADDKEHQDELTRRDQRRRRRNARETAREQHEDQIATATEKRERQQAEAEAERARLLDPTEQLRRAYQQRRWVPLVLVIPAAAAGITSMVNLAVQGARVIDPAGAGVALGAGADLVFTMAMLGLLIARMAGVDRLDSSTPPPTVKLGWFTIGDLGAGLALVGLNVTAHLLPSSDGSPHDPNTGLMFFGLVAGFVFSSVFAPMARRLLDQKFEAASTAVRQSALAARLDAPAEKLAPETAVDVRTAKLMLDVDQRDGLGGVRGDDGLPSGTKIYEAMKQHLGRGNYASAGRVRELMAEMSANHYPGR